MSQLILHKKLIQNKFLEYIKPAQESNQFSNGGACVQLLEDRARDLLKINDNKAIIATSSGTTAHHAAYNAIFKKNKSKLMCGTQAFTFPSSAQGPGSGSVAFDLDSALNINLSEFYTSPTKVLCVTNCFGHLQDFDYIKDNLSKDVYLVLDNAATPYSFFNGSNSCNLGTASFISLHHTKPIGFGEGGLLIIDKEYEKEARQAVNFSFDEEKNFNEWGGNYKMSEVSAAGVLQWWDQFDIDNLREQYLENYYLLKYELKDEKAVLFPHYGDEEFFPSMLPVIYSSDKSLEEIDTKYDTAKYYKPLSDKPVSQSLYNRIICYGIAPK